MATTFYLLAIGSYTVDAYVASAEYRLMNDGLSSQKMRTPHSVDFVSLAQAILVAEHSSFRQAAGILGVQQSAVSRRIRSLEDRLGVSLFERHHGGVRLTAAGAQFFDQARAALMHLEHAINVAAAAGRGERGRLVIGTTSSIAAGFVRELMQTFCDQYPSVALRVSDFAFHEQIALVRKGVLDVAFVSGAPTVANCETTRLWNERLFVALPDRHALSTKAEVGWETLCHEHFIVRQSDQGSGVQNHLITRLAGLENRPSMESLDTERETSMHLVALGLGITVTTAAMAANSFPGVVFRPIGTCEEVIPYSAVWSPNNDNPAFRRFLSLARVRSKNGAHAK